ncbi:hypothetical protein [Plantibacter sp. M259]|uniref:hypothetical protein n=1 Tax=Plantibacter sp. M259 TaxID=2583822 RepID=UPI00111009C0|nr:hypothetical protein [Plantibacter sp. M259]
MKKTKTTPRVQATPYEDAYQAAKTYGQPFWTIAIGKELGYFVGEPDEAADIRLYTLPPDPFTIVGRLVIVRVLVLDRQGNSILTSGGKRKIRYELRKLPRSAYRRI